MATGCANGGEVPGYGGPPVDGSKEEQGEAQACLTDDDGTPTISCGSDFDCSECDPLHRVCDGGQCIGCTEENMKYCPSKQCNAGVCAASCPAKCDDDADCGTCNSKGKKANVCNAHRCAECSPTQRCPEGKMCTPQGSCVDACGTDAKKTCVSDADCGGCKPGAYSCKQALGASTGVCQPEVEQCGMLGDILPDAYDDALQTCESESSCTGQETEVALGELLQEYTGLDFIPKFNVGIPTQHCASVGIVGGDDCGVCAPCTEDSHCPVLDLNELPGVVETAASWVVDLLGGDEGAQKVYMYCQNIAGEFGACLPCSSLTGDCRVGAYDSETTGSCSHDVCEEGGPLKASCDTCAVSICDSDPFCCGADGGTWDDKCVEQAVTACGCLGGGGGETPSYDCHSECVLGGPLPATCSDCAERACEADPYCCETGWDNTCLEIAQGLCELCPDTGL